MAAQEVPWAEARAEAARHRSQTFPTFVLEICWSNEIVITVLQTNRQTDEKLYTYERAVNVSVGHRLAIYVVRDDSDRYF